MDGNPQKKGGKKLYINKFGGFRAKTRNLKTKW